MKFKEFIFIFSILFFFGCRPQEKEQTKLNGGGLSPVDLQVPIYWSNNKLSSPIGLKLANSFYNDLVGEDFDKDGLHHYDLMLAQWNSLYSNKNFFTVPQEVVQNKDYDSLSQYYDNEMGIYRSYKWFGELSSSTLAITQFYGLRKNAGQSGEHIELLHADIIVNYKDNDFSNDKLSHLNYDLPSVILHEVGHFLGLNHEYDWSINSVMRPYLSIYDYQRDISDFDKSTLSKNYAHWTGASLSAIKSRENKRSSSIKGPEFVRGIFELRSNGLCHHFINGQLTLKH